MMEMVDDDDDDRYGAVRRTVMLMWIRCIGVFYYLVDH